MLDRRGGRAIAIFLTSHSEIKLSRENKKSWKKVAAMALKPQMADTLEWWSAA